MKNKLPEALVEKFVFPIEAYKQGLEEERDRIAKLIDNLPFRWDGNTQTITLDKRDVQALVNGDTE
jgi:hypothetical protein